MDSRNSGFVSWLSVYNIGGNNFFKLADLQQYLGYGLAYGEASRCILLDTASAEPFFTWAMRSSQ